MTEGVEWLNYHHLFYFWTVAREGSIARASIELRLAQPTISGQLRELEHSFGEKLFEKKGRSLALTEAGRVAFRYADQIFPLGRELTDALKGRITGQPLRLVVGISDVLPKSIARLLLKPALKLGQPIHLICREDKSVDEFLAELATFELDLVLSDSPASPGIPVRAFSHLLGECGTTFLARPRLAANLRRGFPRSLDGAPLLFPAPKSMLRRSLEHWLSSQELRPNVVAEFDDPALMNLFGEDGTGIFAAPTVIEDELMRRYRVRIVGRVEPLRNRFYALSVERRLKNPAVIAISESARRDFRLRRS